MNNPRILIGLLAASALVVLGSLADAQVKPVNLPTFKKPPSLKVSPGIRLSSLKVQAACGQSTTVHVTVAYKGIISPERVWLWGSLGDKGVDIPAGNGEKSVDITGPALVCDGSGQNWSQVFRPWVILGHNGMTGESFGGSGSKSFVVPE
jgi:hypothetical protein